MHCQGINEQVLTLNHANWTIIGGDMDGRMVKVKTPTKRPLRRDTVKHAALSARSNVNREKA